MISRARFNLRTFNILFALCLGVLPTLRAFAAPAIIPRPPDIAATSYILIDAKTGQVLIQENADEALPPASLTKIMTSYIAIEEIISGRLTLDTPVHISEKAWRMEGSKTFVGVDTMVRAEDLLRGIIIQSGNDASVAIAEHIAGSEEAFADMMNQYAEVMGMQQSFFMNSSGLDTELYYNTMSARDLSLIARETVIKHKDFYPIYAEREFTYNGITQSRGLCRTRWYASDLCGHGYREHRGARNRDAKIIHLWFSVFRDSSALQRRAGFNQCAGLVGRTVGCRPWRHRRCLRDYSAWPGRESNRRG